MLRAHIGSYVNANAVFEIVSDGSVSNISASKRLRQPIESGKWYDIQLVVELDKVSCYLNDSLLMTFTEPQKLFGLAGRDKTSGELIIKMVNGADQDYETEFDLNGETELNGQITAYTIQAESVKAENSFTNPREYIPVKTQTPITIGKKFKYRFPKNSITALRIPVKK